MPRRERPRQCRRVAGHGEGGRSGTRPTGGDGDLSARAIRRCASRAGKRPCARQNGTDHERFTRLSVGERPPPGWPFVAASAVPGRALAVRRAPAPPRSTSLTFPRRQSRVSPYEAIASYNMPQTGSEEHPSELQSLLRISYAVFCLKK